MHDLPQHSYGIVVAHVLKVDVIHLWKETEIWTDTTSVCQIPIMNTFSSSPHLQQHVTGLDPPIGRHRSALHYGADVDASVTSLVTLTHDTDAQEVILL